MKQTTEKPMTVHRPTALRANVEAEAWQIQDIEQGVAEANRGEFASTEEVNSFFAKYGG